MNARNIEKYVKDYLSDEYDFERYMVVFRRNKILEILQKYQPDNILEIGCGISSIFSYYNNFKKAFIVEPSTTFIHLIILKCLYVCKKIFSMTNY